MSKKYESEMAGGNVDQNISPGSYMEPRWLRPDAIREIPNYAVRLLLGAHVIENPNGAKDFESLLIDGQEYVLHKDNMIAVKKFAHDCLNDFLKVAGFDPYTVGKQLRTNPNLLIDSMKWLARHVNTEYILPDNVSKIFFISGDFGACSGFRSEYPFNYFRKNHTDEFFIERSGLVSTGTLNYFDAVMAHRCPSIPMMKIIKSFKRAGKTVIYETDDDMFNVPDFNINSSIIKDEDLARIVELMDLADVILTTNENLRQELRRPEKTMVCPNLIDTEKYVPVDISKSRKLDIKFKGRFLERNKSNGIDIVHQKTGTRRPLDFNPVDPEKFDPIRVLWMGSNTHDGDLESIVEPIKIIGKNYGMAVRFVFFGYAPQEFLYSVVERGNIHQGMAVKDEYVNTVEIINGVNYSQYFNAFNQIPGDFGLCPLKEHKFNLSKSNIKPLELGARKIPSIVTDYGPYQFIEHRVNGLKVDNSTAQWVDSIEELINNVELRKKLAHNIYATVHNDYSWHTLSVGRDMWYQSFQNIAEKIADAREKRQQTFTNSLVVSE